MLTAFAIDIGQIERDVSSTGLSIVRPSETFLPLCEAARGDYLAAFKAARVQPPKKAFRPSDLVARPWRKFAIGSKNGVGESYAQLLQTTYFNPTGSSHPSLNRLFEVIIAVRNQLMKVAPDFGSDPPRHGYWNACRVHHYPRGGGFMMIHCDTYFPVRLGELPFYQVMAPLSTKGLNFSEGGGIIVNRQGERLNTDEVAGLGSLVVCDGRGQHGVEDVDPGLTCEHAVDAPHATRMPGGDARRRGSCDPKLTGVRYRSNALLCSRLTDRGDRAAQVLGPDRLRHVIVHAGRQASFPVTMHRMRGHRDDPRMSAHRPPVRPDCGRRIEPVHLRHLDIHEDGVEVPGGRGGDSGHAVADDGHVVAIAFQ